MTDYRKPDDAKPDTGSCSEGKAGRAPHYNRPGKPAISYRIDTHAGFMRRMRDKLHFQQAEDGSDAKDRPLLRLHTLSNDDPAIALLDAWSMVADILTFYQERIVNEGFLRTATERRSVLELARAVGYELRPGAAASSYLVFTVEDALGIHQAVEVPRGTKVQSIPEPGKLPQVFETTMPLIARSEWNSLRPKLTEEQSIGNGKTALLIEGLNAQLQPGDALLFIGKDRIKDPESSAWQMRVVDAVTPKLNEGVTRVTWKEPLSNLGGPEYGSFSNPEIFVLRERHAALFGSNAPDWRFVPEEVKKVYEELRWENDWPDLEIGMVRGKWAIDLDSIYPRILQGSWIVLADPNLEPRLYNARVVSAVMRSNFTLNAKVTRIEPDNGLDLSHFRVRHTIVFAQSEPLALAKVPLSWPMGGETIELDSSVHGLPENKVLIVSGKRMRASITAADLELRSADAERTLHSGDVLQVLKPPEAKQPERFEPAEYSCTLMDWDGFIGSVVCRPGDIQLQSALEQDEIISEAVRLRSTSRSNGRTMLIFEMPLKDYYDPLTVVIYGNAVNATHGETVHEVLGSGDGTKINQSFELKKLPLTYVSAQNPQGGDSTLEVRVNDVLWEEAPSLTELDNLSRGYIVRIDDGGRTRIAFGDGKNGTRLPTGDENVRATYRSGIGPDGQVAAGSLTLLQNRPPGIRSVTNPIRASGAALQQSMSDARHNTPLTLKTLDRIVSLDDFENFARSFVGIGKAKAMVVTTDEGNVVHITVSAQDGSEIDSRSELFKSFLRAVNNRRRPVDRILVNSFKLMTFRIEASLLIDRHYIPQKVIKQVEAILRHKFSFENRDFGQSVSASEVIASIQDVVGVISVSLDKLELDPPGSIGRVQSASSLAEVKLKSGMDQLSPLQQCIGHKKLQLLFMQNVTNQILKSNPAHLENGRILPAELVLLNPTAAGVVLNVRDLTV